MATVIKKEHVEFIRLVANGTNQSEAYSLTYPNKSLTKGTIKVESSKLAKKYAKEIAEAHQINKDIAEAANKDAIGKTAEMTILTSAKRQEVLSKMILKPDTSNVDIIKAISELNKMDGSHAPKQIEAKVENHVIPELNAEQIKALNAGIEKQY